MSCAKRRVICVITARDGTTVRGENGCYKPQEKCPRKPGDDYTKCRTICMQPGHAEVQAVTQAVNHHADTDWWDAHAFIEGHIYACINCQEVLRALGVNTIHFGREEVPALSTSPLALRAPYDAKSLAAYEKFEEQIMSEVKNAGSTDV
jgi:deoxycytidylate deaminase